MMEVKHSPASKVEYRPNRNGAAEEEDDDLESLFDGGAAKSQTPPSDESDIQATVSSSCSAKNHAEAIDDSPQPLGEVDVDLVKDEPVEEEKTLSKDKSESGAESSFGLDLKLLGLDLPESEPIEKAENGKIASTSNVRDTGDDLDTLMSKINDLVEDCMEPNAGDATTATTEVVAVDEDDIVEIPDDDTESEAISTGVVESAKLTSAEVTAKDAVAKEVTLAATAVKPAEVEKMETDDDSDDVVCIDSPVLRSNDHLPNEDEVMTEVPPKETANTVEEKSKEKEGVLEKEVDAAKHRETVKKGMQAAKKVGSEEPKKEEQEIYLIEDDDDEEDLKKAGSGIKPQEAAEETEEFETESDKAFQEEIEKEIEKEFEDHTKTGGEGEKEDHKSTKPDQKEVDDIVCLDDSLEEPDQNDDEEKKDETKSDEVKGDKEKRASVSLSEPVKETVAAKVIKAAAKEPEPEAEIVEEVLKQVVEEAKSDKPPVAEAKATPAEEKKSPAEPKKPVIDEDDDVVILDDDDDEVEAPLTSSTGEKKDETSSTPVADKESAVVAKAVEATPEKPPTAETSSTVKPSAIISDNSDNARDGVEDKEPAPVGKADKITTVQPPSESNSSSSNLLKESVPRDPEENSEHPPSKRIRLSQDETCSRNSTLSQDESKSSLLKHEGSENKENINEESKKLKRVHSTDNLPSEFKKPKTEGDPSKPTKTELDFFRKRNDVKPLPLYPPPKLDMPTVDLSLDFLKRFKKSIHKMTKTDLEELVLQKIVEAIVHKSDFSEMRDLIEKQEKVIAGHRVKIAELTKQFRDLEMVHNRVLKDLETKNSQFIMPVKITRAVGLQVFFPNKKFDQPILPALSHTVQSPSNASTRNSTSTASGPTERSFSSPADATPSNSAAKQTPANVGQPTVATAAQPQPAPPRRGCVQKLTPLRPDTPRNSPLNRAAAASAVTPTTPSPVVVKTAVTKILNGALTQKSRLSTTTMSGNVVVAPVQTPPSQPVAPPPSVAVEKAKAMGTPPGIATKKASKDGAPKRYHPRIGQSDPQGVAQPLPAAATVVAPLLPPTSGFTGPKGKRAVNVKPVIDLTDEDDVLPTTVNSPRTPVAAAAVPSPSNNLVSGCRYKVSVIPQQQLQQPKPNPPKQTPQRPIAPNVPKQNGVSLAIRQVPANPSRYRHPAPLPNQPVHNSNPAWKLPPARPTIRISNLESGIVISWTIEDTAKDKYAESTSYQIYAYQETSGPPLVESWRHVGDVKAMLLPMAVTLTQFQEGQRYYFAVRAVDAYNRCGPFSCAKTWS